MSDLVAELIGKGRVLDVGPDVQAGPGKRALVDLDRARLLTLAVDLSVPARLRAAVLDITGEVLVRERPAAVDAAQGRGVDPAVVVELVRATIARSPYPVLGIGIGTPASWTGTAPFARPPTSGGPTCRCAISWPTRPVFPCSSRTTPMPRRRPRLSASPGSETWSSCTSVVASDAASSPAATGSPAPTTRQARSATSPSAPTAARTPVRKAGLPRDVAVDTASQGGLDGPDRRDVVEIGGERLGVALAPIVAALDLSESSSPVPRSSWRRSSPSSNGRSPSACSPTRLPHLRPACRVAAGHRPAWRGRTGPLGPARGRLTPPLRTSVHPRAVRPHRPKRKTE